MKAKNKVIYFIFITFLGLSNVFIFDKNFVSGAGAIANNKSVMHYVPFTSQAPLAEWKDARFQDGCEEASVIMAMAWVKGEKLTKNDARKKIIDIAAYERKKFGTYADTNSKDTLERLIGGYYKYPNAAVLDNPKLEDIKKILYEDKLVLAPVNGRKLKNPYFTPPGPEKHMILIKGYDPKMKEFITNDPGTRRGESYKYKENILFDAILDYPTGNHKPIKKTEKAIIIIKK